MISCVIPNFKKTIEVKIIDKLRCHTLFRIYKVFENFFLKKIFRNNFTKEKL